MSKLKVCTNPELYVPDTGCVECAKVRIVDEIPTDTDDTTLYIKKIGDRATKLKYGDKEAYIPFGNAGEQLQVTQYCIHNRDIYTEPNDSLTFGFGRQTMTVTSAKYHAVAVLDCLAWVHPENDEGSGSLVPVVGAYVEKGLITLVNIFVDVTGVPQGYKLDIKMNLLEKEI